LHDELLAGKEIVMLEKYYVRPETVDRVRSSWIAEPIEKYVGWLAERRYSWRTVSRRIPILTSFGAFARKRGASKVAQLPDHLEAYVQQWVRKHAPPGASADQRKKIGGHTRNAVQQMLRLAVPGFVGRRRKRMPENPFQDAAPGFFDFLTSEKGLRPETIDLYRHSLRQLGSHLKRIGAAHVRDLTPVILSGFIAEYGRRVGRSSLTTCCCELRIFLRYLYRQRVLPKDLSGTVGFPQNYRLSGIPRSITWDQVRIVLEGVDRRSSIGRRDYAILLLLVSYGLRAREVAALTLDDIDWHNNRLRVPERKAGHSTAYPLSNVVGEAIVDYLKNGRPQTQERRIFFRSVAPVAPIDHAAVSTRAGYYLRKAGIQVPRPGSHTFRHTCVQRLVDADFSFKTIGDYVGHRSPASTQIYGKVAVEALRQVALGDGEVVL
jgi:integrase/recombinase XerD